MTRAISGNSQERWLLVEFSYGDPTAFDYERLTSWTQDVEHESETWTSLVTLAVSLAPNTGGLQEGVTTITLPLVADGFADKASNGERHSPIFVRVLEQIRDPNGVGTLDTLTLFKGRVKTAKRRKDTVSFDCVSAKGKFQVQIGVTCDVQCRWTLGDHHCKVDLAPLDETATVDSVSGRTVTLDAISDPDATYWSRGYMERNGLRIDIRAWRDTDPLVFELADPPPAEWVGEQVTVVPGCDKTYATCVARFNNESNFGGMGIAMPAWHPSFEGP